MHAQKGLVVGQHEATRRRLRRQQPGLDLVDAGNDFLRMRDPRGRRQRLPRGDVATDADQHKDQPAEHQGSGGVAFCFSGQHRVPQTTIVWSSPMQAPCLCFTSLVRWRHGVACARRRRYPCGESSSRARVGHFSWALPVVVQRAAAPCPRVARGLAHPAGGCIKAGDLARGELSPLFVDHRSAMAAARAAGMVILEAMHADAQRQLEYA